MLIINDLINMFTYVHFFIYLYYFFFKSSSLRAKDFIHEDLIFYKRMKKGC